LTVELNDVKEEVINLDQNKVTFRGKAAQKEYQFELEFNKEVDPEQSKKAVTPRNICFVIYKKEEGYWPKLTKGSKV